MLECSIYDAFLCDDFGGDGCAGASTLGTDAVSENTLGDVAGWGARTGDFVFCSSRETCGIP